MTKRTWILAGMVLLLGCESTGGRGEERGGGEEAGEEVSGPAGSFATATVHFEQNATDGDVEIVFAVKGGDEGLSTLRIVAPDGRTVVDFRAPDGTTLGMRQFRFESPEPRDVASLRSAYPEGAYAFTGTTFSGERLHAEATLSHALPEPSSFVAPEPEAEGVGTDGLIIKWTPVGNLSAYIVYIEHEDLSWTARVPGSVAQLAVPGGFLQPGTEYQLGIGTEQAGGNASYVETTIVTASR